MWKMGKTMHLKEKNAFVWTPVFINMHWLRKCKNTKIRVTCVIHLWKCKINCGDSRFVAYSSNDRQEMWLVGGTHLIVGVSEIPNYNGH